MTQKRTRTTKPDRLTSPDATRAENLVHFAVAPFDNACREYDRKWGCDRLPELVSPETAAVWAKTMANLNDAIAATFNAEDPDQALSNVTACVASCLRGFEVMDAEATRANAKPASTRIIEMQMNGTRVGIMEDGAAWPALKDERPDLVLYTPQEVLNALESVNSADRFIEETVKAFPNAKLSKIAGKPVDYVNGGDQFSFD